MMVYQYLIIRNNGVWTFYNGHKVDKCQAFVVRPIISVTD